MTAHRHPDRFSDPEGRQRRKPGRYPGRAADDEAAPPTLLRSQVETLEKPGEDEHPVVVTEHGSIA
jgi:hypothetical protein